MAKRVRLSAEEREKRFNDDKQFLLNLEAECKNENGIYNLNYPVCITSVHNRKPTILDNLEQFGNTKINVFVYDFERDMYTWLENKDNVNIVYVPEEYLRVQRMRLFIQNYMGDQKYWTCDDDVIGIMMPNDKHFVGIAHAMTMIERATEGKNFPVVSFGHVELGCKYWNGGIFVETYGSVCMLNDGKLINEVGLKYTGDVNVNEDIEFVINSHLKGIPVKVCAWACLKCYEPSGGKRSQASTPEQHTHYQESLYIKYGDWVRIRLETRRGYTASLRYSKFNDPKTYDEELLSLCKAGDKEGIISYLKKKKGIEVED